MLDIDYGSPYHPRHDPLALDRITAALEPLGLLSSVTITSSASRGLHIYYPFPEELPSWQIAAAISTLLENAGLKRIPGWLEVFPDPKPFSIEGSPNLYNGHRLPLQSGSYLLNKDLNPTGGSTYQFTKQWQAAANHNSINAATLRAIIRQAQRRPYRVSQKATKFLNDLNAEIELGWTGKGQTNRLLGRIAMRSYVFGHILSPGTPLIGEALVNAIVATAQNLPGYSEFCAHQHEIEHRAQEWAKCVEASHYYPYGTNKSLAPAAALMTSASEQPNWNQQQQNSARDRITGAIQKLTDGDRLPDGITARYEALTKEGISGSTLYRHKDLWHPAHLKAVENPPDPPAALKELSAVECFEASTADNPTNLLKGIGGDFPQSNTSSSSISRKNLTAGCNAQSGYSDKKQISPAMSSQTGVTLIRQLLSRIKKDHTSAKFRFPEQKQHRQAQDQQLAFNTYQETKKRMEQWLHSKDPILKAEAAVWLSAHELENQQQITKKYGSGLA